ncbi:maleylpyruvate isomerase N-terminal domain-containing protein [Xylanimonas sp. McL0601]|uniref:maleylpyruvate isomerase N-terminal domain-containing protein n=1 Tax=Xylanimonas sp. McL0601 TaxID=3414739 RepID=UPI003CE78007
MNPTFDFTDLLGHLDDRSAAFRATVDAAPDIDVPVPSCPEWTLFDLAAHLGGGDRYWAELVATGPADAPSDAAVAARTAVPAPRDREALVAWLDDSTRLLVDVLQTAGPDRGCWAWYGFQSPHTSASVARHRLQETTVHTYDAQLSWGVEAALPADVALDGVEEFLFSCVSTTSPWPHHPATFDLRTSSGHGWRLEVDGDGARSIRLDAAAPEVSASVGVTGTASDLVLYLYDRLPADALQVTGEAGLLDLLRAWEPED